MITLFKTKAKKTDTYQTLSESIEGEIGRRSDAMMKIFLRRSASEPKKVT